MVNFWRNIRQRIYDFMRFADEPDQELETLRLLRLRRLEPLIAVALGLHGIGVFLWLYEVENWHWVGVITLFVMGLWGLAQRPIEGRATIIRALLIAIWGWLLIVSTGGVYSFFFVWYLVVVVAYPLLIDARWVSFLIPCVAVAYALLMPISPAPEVVLLRALLLVTFGFIARMANVITTRYIVERRRLDAFHLALEQQRREVLRQFLENSSHDLRTPLTTINTSIYLIRKFIQDKPAEALRKLDSLEEQTSHLQKVLLDMLKMVELEQPGESQYFSLVDLQEVVRQVYDQGAQTAHKKRQHLDFQINGDSFWIVGDIGDLRILTSNLLTNAVNYTPEEGHIIVTLSLDNTDVVLAVQDSGPGINKNDLPVLFDYFYRGDKARNTAKGGAGLGLAMVKKIAELHNGSVTVESVVGQGSTFRVHFPASQKPGEVP